MPQPFGANAARLSLAEGAGPAGQMIPISHSRITTLRGTPSSHKMIGMNRSGYRASCMNAVRHRTFRRRAGSGRDPRRGGPRSAKQPVDMVRRQADLDAISTPTTISPCAGRFSYIWHRRLERIRHDLANPALAGTSITEIAFGRGFSSSTHFSRSFRESYGVSPRVYRLLMQGTSLFWQRAAQRQLRSEMRVPAPAE